MRGGATGVGAAAMRSMVDDVASLCLIKECKELEEGFRPQFTDNSWIHRPDQHERGEESDWAAGQREED